MLDEEENLSDSPVGQQAKPEEVEGLNAFKDQDTKEWRNRNRTLIVCSRGVNHKQRHLVEDMEGLLPHGKKEAKIEKHEK